MQSYANDWVARHGSNPQFKIMKQIFKISFGGSLVRTIIYTIGHMCIAITCLMLIADVSFNQALTDAIVEPLLNGVWYFVLDRLWIKYFSKDR